jgi:hypothetical protein
MPPLTTVNGQTGYYMNGQFVPATQQEYDAQFNAPQQRFSNPFLPQVQQPQTNRTEYVTQGIIQSPENAAMSNEQKVMQKQGNESNAINNSQIANPYQNLNQNVNAYVQNAFSQAQAMRQTQQSPYTPNGTVIQQGPQQSNAMSNPLVQGANNAVFQNPFINPAAPTQTQVPSPVAPTTPEITPTTTAQQPNSGNFFNNMFNRPSDQIMAGANEAANSSGSFQDSYSAMSGKLGKIGAEGKGGDGFKMDAKKAFTGSATTSLIGSGINAASKLIGANAGNYDERVGMTKPNLGGTLLGDATFTQMGSMFGPAGMAIGGTVDLVKNAIKYVKQKDKYENKKLATNTMQSIDDARENMKPDYTGYARFGAQINNPYLKKKYNNGGKVIVDGKEVNTSSQEYKNLYDAGVLMGVDYEGLPNMYAPEVEVTAKMTDKERVKRGLMTESHRRDKAAMSELGNAFAESTGIPSLIRVGKDPLGHLQSALKTMDGISTLGTMPYDAYNTPEDLSKALDVVGAAGTVMPLAKAARPIKLNSPLTAQNTAINPLQQRYQKLKWSQKNPQTGKYDVFEEEFPIDQISYRDPISDPFLKTKMKSLLNQEDGYMWPVMDYLRTKKLLPKTSWDISEKIADPLTGILQDGNTRFWLNKRYNKNYGLEGNKHYIQDRLSGITRDQKYKPLYSSDNPVNEEWIGSITNKPKTHSAITP